MEYCGVKEMNFLVSAYSDIGIRKETNQDSVLVEVAQVDNGQAAFAMICDGMGGLARGELASATVIKAFAQWFQFDFPQLLKDGFSKDMLWQRWKEIVFGLNSRIDAYGQSQNINLGTTAVGLLLMGQSYYVMNIGDSRVYRLGMELEQITKDQTFVQREMDAGRMTPEEARVDARRNMLLQCIGSSDYLEPDFFSGRMYENEVYMLCSDGFRHIITDDEIYEYLNPDVLHSEKDMLENSTFLTELNKHRKEEDNISVAVIKTC